MARGPVTDDPVSGGPVAPRSVFGAVWGGLGFMARQARPARETSSPRGPFGAPRRGSSRSAAGRQRAGRLAIALCSFATILIGCPLYPDECDSQNDCASGFYCERFSGQCQPTLDAIGCTRPDQCEVGETCTPDFVCRPGSCEYHGCVRGYRCGIVDLAHTCISNAVPDVPVDASLPPPAGDGGAADGGVPDAGGALDAGTGDAGDASL